MRTALVVACLGIFALAACGDAGAEGGLVRHTVTDPTPGATASDNPNDPGDQNNGAPGDPNANTPPSQPTTPGTTSPSFEVALDQTALAADLGSTTPIKVTVTPKSGFTGSVTLAVSGLPQGVTAAFNPASLTLGSSAMTSTLTLSTPITTATTAVGAAADALVVTATSGAASATANANFKVNAKMQIEIPLNVAALRQATVRYVNNWSANLVGGDAIVTQKTPLLTQTGNPINVTVINADSASHIVHGQNGFAHGDTSNPVPPMTIEMQNGAPRVRNLAVGVNCQGYPHDGTNGVGASFHIQVQASP